MVKINIVSDEACPRCGAYWGHPDPKLDFPNRPKVDNHFKCYNPKCTCGFYHHGVVLENVPSKREHEKMVERIKKSLEGVTVRVIDYTSDGPPVESEFTIPKNGE